jgi:hypothetical protein
MIAWTAREGGSFLGSGKGSKGQGIIIEIPFGFLDNSEGNRI